MTDADPSPALDAVDRYLARHAGAFWRWSPSGEAIEAGSSSGQRKTVTLVFREELATIFAHLRARGLPPLGAVIPILVATRDDWHVDSPDTRGLQVETLRALSLVHRLPASLRATPAARALLVATLYENSPVTCPPTIAHNVVERLGRASFTVPEAQLPSARDEATVQAALALWIKPDSTPSDASVERLELALRTGLDQLPRAADLVSSSHTARELLAELRRDPKLSGFARFVDTVRGATVIPPLRAGREDLPTGGVADVSHRGPIERLLLTELVHDDESLAVRVALDEALYLRREAARVRPPVERAILIDAGLRTWGLPRVMLTAIALAWIVESDGEARVQRAGRPPTPIRLDRRADLVAHLSSVTSILDATSDLATFTSACRSDDEPVLLLHRRTVDSSEFRTQLGRCPALARGVLVATADETGHYGIARWTHRGRVIIRDGVLDLRPIVGPSTNITPVPGLPRLFQERDFPLSLAAPPESPCVAAGEEFLVVADPARILRTDARGIGREIYRALPNGELLWLSEERGTVRYVVRVPERDVVIASTIRPDGSITLTSFPCAERIVAADFSLGHHVGLFLRDPARVRIHSIDREAPVTEFPARPLQVQTRWPQPIFFGYGDNFATLGQLASGSGGNNWVTSYAADARSLIATFLPLGSEWPSVVNQEGKLSSLDPRDSSSTSIGRVWGIARDGSRLRILRSDAPETYDLESKQRLSEREPLDRTPEFRRRRSDIAREIRSLIVGADRAGEPGVWLSGSRRILKRLDRRATVEEANASDSPHGPRHPQRDARPFGEPIPLPDSSLTAAHADFADGSTAWLDDRGVLLLVPSDAPSRTVAVVISSVNDRGVLQGSDLGWIAPNRVLSPNNKALIERDQAVAAFARCVIEAGGAS
ncbi:MAG: hypothetical protein AAF488_04025 [Planctomycetota bacterium]